MEVAPAQQQLASRAGCTGWRGSSSAALRKIQCRRTTRAPRSCRVGAQARSTRRQILGSGRAGGAATVLPVTCPLIPGREGRALRTRCRRWLAELIGQAASMDMAPARKSAPRQAVAAAQRARPGPAQRDAQRREDPGLGRCSFRTGRPLAHPVLRGRPGGAGGELRGHPGHCPRRLSRPAGRQHRGSSARGAPRPSPPA